MTPAHDDARSDHEYWDVVVIGGGTAGIVAAKTAARLGSRVLLIERERPGGDCLWTGCVPSKTLLAAAHAAAHARNAAAKGVTVTGVDVDFPAVMESVRVAIATIAPIDSPETLATHGVTVLQGEAAFVSPRSIVVAGTTIRFGRAVLATGASPAVPPVPGLREANPLTSDSVWELTELPRRMVIMGAGAIGAELGQAFARLGSEVTIVEGADRVLVREDPRAGAAVARALEADGATLKTGHMVTSVTGDRASGGTLVADKDGEEVTITYDALLVAVGRRARVHGMGLDKADISVTDQGTVQVDSHLRTTNHRVWAAGDLTGHPQFTHLASAHGSLAASNAVLGLRRSVSTNAIPRVTFTDPEVAAVGAPTWSDDGTSPTISTREHAEVDRAVAEDSVDGFATLALGKRDRIIGATVVGPRAGESLAELTLAVQQGLTTRDIAKVIHPYPTYADGPWNAAVVNASTALDKPLVKRLIGALRWLRRP